jgi:hypothetical protein
MGMSDQVQQTIRTEAGRITVSRLEDGSLRLTLTGRAARVDVDVPLEGVAMYQEEREAIVEELEILARMDPSRADVARQFVAKIRR